MPATTRLLSALIVPLLTLPGHAADCPKMPARTEAIAAAKLIIENNAADGDIGVHGLFDDSGWSALCVYGPDGKPILQFLPHGALGDLTIAGFFFESREPLNDEFSYEALKAAFPQGDYRVEALAHDGTGRVGQAHFTTVVPSMPEITTPGLVDTEDEVTDPIGGDDFDIAWAPVVTSLDGRPLVITGYELIVTKDKSEDPNGFSQPILDVHLPPDRLHFEIGEGFLEPGNLYEVEVLAIEQSGNQTIGIKWFRTK